MKRLLRVLGAMAFAVVLVAPAQAAPMVFFTDASFLAAAGSGLTFEGFETATQAGNVVTFPGGTFSCAGTSFCSSFFGVSAFSDTGFNSVAFSTDDTATFALSAPVTAFGLAIGGAGDVAPLTLTALLSNGSSVTALGPGFTGPGGVVFGSNRQFFGVIDTVPFLTVAFSGSNFRDGIYFDTMSRGLAAPTVVPEPASLLLVGSGLVAAYARRRRSALKSSSPPAEV